MAGFKLKVTPEMEALTEIVKTNSQMDTSLYGKYDVKRGLRDINGKGVLAGLTQISNIVSSKMVDGQSVSPVRESFITAGITWTMIDSGISP